MNEKRYQFLQKLKEYGEKNNIPNITEANARCIHFLIRMKKARRVLEIGTANGYSSIWIADAIEKEPNSLLIGIDVSEPSIELARQNIQKENLEDTVIFKHGNAMDILPTIQEKFDIVFIDAQKSMYARFWKAIQHCITKDTLIIVDDILKFPEKTKSLLNALKNDSDFESVILPTDTDDGILLIQSTL